MKTLASLAILCAVLALYASHVRNASFVFEDDRVLTSTAFSSWGQMLTTGRGLTTESWTHIRTPSAAHALNVALHLMIVLLCGLLFWQITGVAGIGLGIAGIVALHPLTTEGVAYATSRAELIAAIGALLALLAVSATPRWPWLLVPGALLVAYAGKETGIVAVALIPLVLWAAGQRTRLEDALWLIGGALVVTSAIWLPHIPALLVLGHTPRMQVGVVAWVLTQAEAVWRLIVLSVAPWPGWLSASQNITGPTWIGGGAALVLLAGLLEGAWRARTSAPLLTLGIVWCAIVAAPRFLVRTPLSPFNEHQWYLAIPGVACCLMAGIDRIAAWRETTCPA